MPAAAAVAMGLEVPAVVVEELPATVVLPVLPIPAAELVDVLIIMVVLVPVGGGVGGAGVPLPLPMPMPDPIMPPGITVVPADAASAAKAATDLGPEEALLNVRPGE